MTRNVSIAAPDGTLASIQALRAAAALAVVAYHALQWCRGGFDVGRAGVDVFFVISGVIMWRITAGRPVAARAFLWRRFTRVAPLYWLATALVFVIALRWPLFLPEVKPGWGHLAKSLAFIPHLDPVGLPFPTLPPGWTLNYEAVFYLVFAACLWTPERLRARVVVAALATIVVAGFFFPDSAYFMGANPMLLQFAAGVGLGVAAQAGRLPSRAWGTGADPGRGPPVDAGAGRRPVHRALAAPGLGRPGRPDRRRRPLDRTRRPALACRRAMAPPRADTGRRFLLDLPLPSAGDGRDRAHTRLRKTLAVPACVPWRCRSWPALRRGPGSRSRC